MVFFVDMDSYWSVYMHTNKANGKKYVGITSKDPKRRWGNNGSGYRKNQYFWRSIQKYGWDNFEHEILFTNVTKGFACFAERCLVACHKTDDPLYGYNLTSGGDKGCTYSEESRRKISEARKGKYTGENSPMFGISPKERMDEKTYQQWLYKQQTNKPRGKDHPMYGVSMRERMDEEAYWQWREKTYDSPKNISVKCIETDKVYKSAREAERDTGIGHSSIMKSCESEDHSVIAGGFHWCFGDENLTIEDLGLTYKGKRYIRCVETDKVYQTARQVKRETGFDDSFISKCCKSNGSKTAGGLHWEYIYLFPEQYEEWCKAQQPTIQN